VIVLSGKVSFRLNTDGTGFLTCKECPKAFEIIPLQTARKENNWKPKKRWREQLQLRRRNGLKVPILDEYDNDNGGNSLPSFFNHDQQQIFCSVHGSIIVNYHNVVTEVIPFIWQKTERELT